MLAINKHELDICVNMDCCHWKGTSFNKWL